MRNGRAGEHQFTVALEDPNELFEVRPADVAQGRPPEAPGIDQIRDELSALSRKVPVTIAIELRPDRATPHVERGLKLAIARYCEAGIARADSELRAIRRDGMRTLLFGAVALGVFLALSQAVLRSGLPQEFRDFFGNGLFVVAAWVGLWYPLDTLIYSGRPSRHERKLLRAISEVEVVVRARAQEPLAASLGV